MSLQNVFIFVKEKLNNFNLKINFRQNHNYHYNQIIIIMLHGHNKIIKGYQISYSLMHNIASIPFYRKEIDGTSRAHGGVVYFSKIQFFTHK